MYWIALYICFPFCVRRTTHSCFSPIRNWTRPWAIFSSISFFSEEDRLPDRIPEDERILTSTRRDRRKEAMFSSDLSPPFNTQRPTR